MRSRYPKGRPTSGRRTRTSRAPAKARVKASGVAARQKAARGPASHSCQARLSRAYRRKERSRPQTPASTKVRTMPSGACGGGAGLDRGHPSLFKVSYGGVQEKQTVHPQKQRLPSPLVVLC